MLASCAVLALAAPVLAGAPYEPLPLAPAQTVTPTEDMLADIRAFHAAVKSGDGDAIAAGIGDRVTAVSGNLELELPRRKEIVGPHKTIEAMLSDLANYIGGDVEEPPPGGDPEPNRLRAEREFIVEALTDGQWGRDPMVKNAVCTYAYRSYDIKALKRLSRALGVAGSSFFYVDAPYALHAAPDAKAPSVFQLEPDRLYALDYDTDAPGSWIAVHLPEGGSAFASYDEVALERPYASGLCFAKGKDGHWRLTAQASTGL